MTVEGTELLYNNILYPDVSCSAPATATSCFVGGPDTLGSYNGGRGGRAREYHIRVVATNSVGAGKPAKVRSSTVTPPNCSYIGPYAYLSTTCDITNWSGLDLQGAWLLELYGDLAGANLSNTNLEEAELPYTMAGANLTGTNLFHAGIAETDLTGVTWSNTTCPDGTNSDNDGGTCVNNLSYSLLP